MCCFHSMLILRADACHSICKICILYVFFFFSSQKKLTNTKSLEWLQIQYVFLCVATLFILSLNGHTFFFNHYRLPIDRATDQNDARTTVIHIKDKGHPHDHK